MALSAYDVTATIKEAIQFPESCVYKAVLGYYGDVKDVTTYKGQYCRVYQKVVNAKYTFGKSMSDGNNTFVREPVDEPTDANTAISEALQLYNSCIFTNGFNTYEPR